MKILVLNGSPKREKSVTLSMTKAFLDGLCRENDQVEIIHVTDCDIQLCSGCMICMYNGGTCVIRDDMDIIMEKMLESDIVIFSYPIYWFSMPSLMKMVADRLLPIASVEIFQVDDHSEHILQKDISSIRFIMISSGGYPSVNRNFEPAKLQFQTMFSHSNTIITIPEGPLYELSEYTPCKEKLFSLLLSAGQEYETNGSLSENTVDKLSQPTLPPRIYNKLNSYVYYLRKELNEDDT